MPEQPPGASKKLGPPVVHPPRLTLPEVGSHPPTQAHTGYMVQSRKPSQVVILCFVHSSLIHSVDGQDGVQQT